MSGPLSKLPERLKSLAVAFEESIAAEDFVQAQTLLVSCSAELMSQDASPEEIAGFAGWIQAQRAAALASRTHLRESLSLLPRRSDSTSQELSTWQMQL